MKLEELEEVKAVVDSKAKAEEGWYGAGIVQYSSYYKSAMMAAASKIGHFTDGEGIALHFQHKPSFLQPLQIDFSFLSGSSS